jgi:hypothetical protein
VVGFVLIAMAQEFDNVPWDPADGAPPDWVEPACWATLGIAAYVYWRLAKWFIAHRRDHPGWRALRYWIPASIAVLDAAALLPMSTPGNEVRADVAGAAVAGVNLPVLPAAHPCHAHHADPQLHIFGYFDCHFTIVAAVFLERFQFCDCFAFGIVTLLAWLSWHASVRFPEWRSSREAPLSLLPELTSSPPPRS